MTAADFPRVNQLLGTSFYLDCELDLLDPVLRIDTWLWFENRERGLEAVLAEVRQLEELSPDEESAKCNLQAFLGIAGVPQGHTWREFLLLTGDRIERASARPEVLLKLEDEDNFLKRARYPKFTNEPAADESCTYVLRRHEAELRAWAADRGGLWRQHYYADLGESYGTVNDVRAGWSGPVTGVVVVMRMTHDTSEPFIYDAYPEVPLDESVRAEYPMLRHLFGGYFGDVGDLPWPAQWNFLQSTKEPARGRIAVELDRLLTDVKDDDELRRAVEALGSHVLPQAVRAWVELIRWRIDRAVAT